MRLHRSKAAGACLLLAGWLLTAAAAAASQPWVVEAGEDDLLVKRAADAETVFSARRYMAERVAEGFQQVSFDREPRGCAVVFEVRALSVLGDALSLEITFRRLPEKDCGRSFGYHGVKVVALEDSEDLRLQRYVDTDAVMSVLRREPQVIELLGPEAASTTSLPDLFARLDEVAGGQCHRRLPPSSESTFYLADTDTPALELRIPWHNQCGQLADEPQLDSLSVTLTTDDLKPGVVPQVLTAPELQLMFEEPR